MIVHKVSTGNRTGHEPQIGAHQKIYIGCAAWDTGYRDMMVSFKQRWGFYTKNTFDFLTHDRRELALDQWKESVRKTIRRANGVMMLVSNHTASDACAAWEIDCAVSNDIPIVGVDIRKKCEGAIPTELVGKMTKYGWEWFAAFIDGL
jgi:hypothetical protein